MTPVTHADSPTLRSEARKGAAATLLVVAILTGAAVAALSVEPLPQAAPKDAAEREATTVLAIAQVHGPATGGLPALPLAVDDDGRLVGEATLRDAGAAELEAPVDVAQWFRYCGQEERPGLSPAYAGDHALRYVDMGRLTGDAAQWGESWYAARHGEPVRAGDVPPGRAALAAWRTDGLNLTEGALVYVYNPNATITGGLTAPVSHGGLVAFSATSTHRCVLVEHAAAGSPQAEHYAARVPALPGPRGHLFVDSVHGSVWNPHWVVRDTVETAAPR